MNFDVETEEKLSCLVNFMSQGVSGVNRKTVTKMAIGELYNQFSRIEGFEGIEKDRSAVTERSTIKLFR